MNTESDAATGGRKLKPLQSYIPGPRRQVELLVVRASLVRKVPCVRASAGPTKRKVYALDGSAVVQRYQSMPMVDAPFGSSKASAGLKKRTAGVAGYGAGPSSAMTAGFASLGS